MVVTVTLNSNAEYSIDLVKNGIEDIKTFGEILELAPGRMLKTDDGKTYVQAKAIVVVKEV